MAAELAVEGNKISSAYSFLLHDVGTRLADSVRDVAESVIYNLCLSDARKVAEGIVINSTERASNKNLKFVYDSDGIVSEFESERAAALAAEAQAAAKGEHLSGQHLVKLKQALYKLARMDIEILTGPLAAPDSSPISSSSCHQSSRPFQSAWRAAQKFTQR